MATLKIIEESTGNDYPVFVKTTFNMSVENMKGFVEALVLFRPSIATLFWDESSSLNGTKKFHFEIDDDKYEDKANIVFVSDSFVYETTRERRHREYLDTLAHEAYEKKVDVSEEQEDYSNI